MKFDLRARDGAESQHTYPPTSGRIQFPRYERATILKCKSDDLLVRVLRSKNIGKYGGAQCYKDIYSALKKVQPKKKC